MTNTVKIFIAATGLAAMAASNAAAEGNSAPTAIQTTPPATRVVSVLENDCNKSLSGSTCVKKSITDETTTVYAPDKGALSGVRLRALYMNTETCTSGGNTSDCTNQKSVIREIERTGLNLR